MRVSVCVRTAGMFFFILCVGARIGLSVTVKSGGVGDDRCLGARQRGEERA